MQIQHAYGNQAALAFFGRNPVLIQRKTVPKLVEGRVRWYDDTDPEQTLFDTEEEAAAAASGASGGLAMPGLNLPGGVGMGMSLDAPIVNTWSAPPRGGSVGGSVGTAPRGGSGTGSGGLLPIFDIRNSRAQPAKDKRETTASNLMVAYLREFADAGPVAQTVLTITGGEVTLATAIMRHLVPPVRTLACALLVRSLMASNVPDGLIDTLIGALAEHGASAGAFVPVVGCRLCLT